MLNHINPTEIIVTVKPILKRKLQTRAIYYVSKRDYSTHELTQKLRPVALKLMHDLLKEHTHQINDTNDTFKETIDSVLSEILNDLTLNAYLNDVRFAQQRAYQSSKKHGTQAVIYELSKHHIDVETTDEIAQTLKDTELERCYAVWVKRFGKINVNINTDFDKKTQYTHHAKQGRFLTQRGFSSESIKKVLNGWKPNDTD